MRDRVLVAMSGGVDSSTVAALLHSRGERIVGLTMQLWNQRRLPELHGERTTGRCCSLDDVYDARYVAQKLGIPYYVVNFEERFEESVVKPFVSEGNHWMVEHHGYFQGYYFWHHLDGDRNARDAFADSPHYARCEEFCALYDQIAFDPTYQSYDLDHYRPLLAQFFDPR